MIDEFKVIVVMNEAMIRTLKNKNEDFQKNKKIKEYLNDEGIFFKIKKSDAFIILTNVGIKQEQLEKVYNKLISPNTYFDLLNKGILKENDEKIIIKYKSYRF